MLYDAIILEDFCLLRHCNSENPKSQMNLLPWIHLPSKSFPVPLAVTLNKRNSSFFVFFGLVEVSVVNIEKETKESD
jgi:hypothetical protein